MGFYNDHWLCSESLGVRRQVRWGGCGTGTMSRVSGKAVDRFQCTWIAMIGEMHRLIAEYLGNRFRWEPANYIEMCCPIKATSVCSIQSFLSQGSTRSFISNR